MAVDANKPLTDKQKLFADYYVGEASLNAVRAARMAKYNGSYNHLGVIGFKNLRLPHVRKYIDDRLAEIAASPSEVLIILGRQAKSAVGDLFDDEGKFDLKKARENGLDSLIKKIKVTESKNQDTGEIETTYEVELYSAQNAAVQLGKVHKMFTERHELTGPDGGPIQTTQIVIQGVPGAEGPGKNDSDESDS